MAVNYAEKTDQQLVRACKRGDEQAARELISRFERPVFSIIYRMVRDRELAEDLAQEAFVRTFNNLKRYDPSYQFSSWIFKISHNLTIDHLRKKALDTISMHGAPDAITASQQEATSLALVSRDELPDQEFEAQLLGSEIEQAIAQLRPEYRTAVILRHVEGRQYEEISEIMEIPLGTVKTYIHRARNELRGLLGHLMEDEE